MELIQENLRKVQLNLLRTFIEICNRHKLKYFARGGTAIGAVRHHGYIPWDDDIDVIMPVNDYDKFLNVAREELPDYIFVQNLDTEPKYVVNRICKLRDSRTTFIEESVSHLHINHGIFIDIFICYYASDNYFFRLLCYFLQKVYILRLIVEVNPKYKQKAKLHTRILQNILSIIFPNPNSVRNKLEKLFRSTKKSSTYILSDGSWGIKGLPITWFRQAVFFPFEDIDIALPIEYHLFLEKTVGDYMSLPPSENRIAHHFAEIIDANNSYVEYSLYKNNEPISHNEHFFV